MSNRKLSTLFIAITLMFLACTSISQFVGMPDPNNPGIDSKELEDDSISADMTSQARMISQYETENAPNSSENDENGAPAQSSGAAPCTGIEIFEEDIRENDQLFPDVVVYANGEAINPPKGFQISYPPHPDSQPFNQYWRIILLDGGTIQVTTNKPVACAGVIFISDYISPVSIYIDGELMWEGYLYPPAANNPSKAFYVRFAVEPARTINIQVVGHAPGGDYQNAYVPVYAFGFELP